MASRIPRIACIGIAAALLVSAVASIVLLTRPNVPPHLTIEFLGFTNRNRPYALLAITNRSTTRVTLDGQCLMLYPGSVEPLTLRVTQLGPGEGFVDEIFAFPAGARSQWRFECYASRTSSWLELRRAVELWYHKNYRKAQFPPRSKTWHTFQTKAIDCPP